MGSIGKSFALILFLIMVIPSLSLLTTKTASAQTIPIPSVPQFTLSLVSHPYYVAPIATINPYTGQNETTQAGYYVQNMSIVVTIKNQPFSYSYNGTTYNLYYNVREKGHFEQDDWNELYLADVGTNLTNTQYYPPLESNSDYTVLSYLVGANGDYPFTQLPPNAQVDFQVEAVVGYETQVFVPSGVPGAPSYLGSYMPAIAFVTSSGWSNTQTITIPASSSSASPSPTVPEFPILTILSMLTAISTIVFFTIAIRNRHRSISTKS